MIGEQQFPFLAEKGHVVSLVGGGGKTTLLYAMASHCALKGWRVLVSTTTHILRPENGLWAKTDAEIQELWARGSYAVVGSPAPKGKLTAPPEADLAHWMAQADAVFLEADGAKHFPCKAPAEQEPVLLPQSDIVLAVAGLSALGHPLKECCFRLEQACMLLDVPPETGGQQGLLCGAQSGRYAAAPTAWEADALCSAGTLSCERRSDTI